MTAPTPKSASLDDARRMLALLARPGDVFELRGLVRVNGQQHTTSGYFDDVEQLARAACHRSGDDAGVYMTLNPVHPGLLSRKAKNRVHRAGNGETTSDKDVRTRRSILIDIDPTRPAGISSTAEEHDAAIDLARSIRDALSATGWPAPILADSGNGGHLIYAVDLPVDDGGLVQRVLRTLSAAYSTPAFKIDEKVYNPARISKIYGTLTKKGENTTDRPHRLARIIEAPATLEAIPRVMLERYAPESKQLTEFKHRVDGNAASRMVDRTPFDLEAWVARFFPDARESTWSDGRKWVLPICPFEPSHDRGEAGIFQLSRGGISAKCQHDSCRWGWRELRERFEPDAYQRARDQVASERSPPHEVLFEDSERLEAIAEIEAFAARDREDDRAPPPDRDRSRTNGAEVAAPKPPPWKRGPDLVDEIWLRKDEPWIGMHLGPDELVRVRNGGIVVVMGGPAGGKSSLVSNLLLQHARDVGPAIALSIELPADELAARIVGIKCDASWEDVLCGRLAREHMVDALNMPRLYVLDRENATMANLRAAVTAARLEYPNEPILAAIDYTQLMDSNEREVRLRVADSFKQIDAASRDLRFVTLAVSQMSRAAANTAVRGEALGAETASLGAESAAIERFASVTMTIGTRGEPREDGSRATELNIGKMRMGDGGDRVLPMSFWGKSGLWRVTGDAQSATKVRETRDAEKVEQRALSKANEIIGLLARSEVPLDRTIVCDMVKGRKADVLKAIAQLIQSGDLVEVARRSSVRSRSWMVWTLDRSSDAKIPLVREMSGSND